VENNSFCRFEIGSVITALIAFCALKKADGFIKNRKQELAKDVIVSFLKIQRGFKWVRCSGGYDYEYEEAKKLYKLKDGENAMYMVALYRINDMKEDLEEFDRLGLEAKVYFDEKIYKYFEDMMNIIHSVTSSARYLHRGLKSRNKKDMKKISEAEACIWSEAEDIDKTGNKIDEIVKNVSRILKKQIK